MRKFLAAVGVLWQNFARSPSRDGFTKLMLRFVGSCLAAVTNNVIVEHATKHEFCIACDTRGTDNGVLLAPQFAKGGGSVQTAFFGDDERVSSRFEFLRRLGATVALWAMLCALVLIPVGWDAGLRCAGAGRADRSLYFHGRYEGCRRPSNRRAEIRVAPKTIGRPASPVRFRIHGEPRHTFLASTAFSDSRRGLPSRRMT